MAEMAGMERGMPHRTSYEGGAEFDADLAERTIEHALDNLDKAIAEHHEYIEILSTRLHGILRPVLPSPADVNANNAVAKLPIERRSEVQVRIDGLASALRKETEALGALSSRIDV